VFACLRQVVEGEDLFVTASGCFWHANLDAQLHVAHCVELMAALVHAGSTPGHSATVDALGHGCRALELDCSDGGGGASAGGAGSCCRSGGGLGEDYRAPCHSVALASVLLGLPGALGANSSGGNEARPAKKTKLDSTSSSSSSNNSGAHGGKSAAATSGHGGAVAALEATPHALQRRCL
jgi:hypothetical protein